MNPNDVSVGSSEDQEMMDANANPKNNHNIAKKQIKGIKVKGHKRNLKNYKNMSEEVDEPEISKKRKLPTMITQSNFAKRPSTLF